MAHARDRHLEIPLKKILGFSPLVGVLGHRQVGKTTLVEKIAKTYVTFDQTTSHRQASQDAEGFIKRFNAFPVGLDESQLVPELFPSLKDHVRLHKRPGQFILTGSVRFTSRRAIRESLTGRIVLLELLPLCVTEMLARPPSKILLALMKAEWRRHFETTLSDHLAPASELAKGEKSFWESTRKGGLPGVCFIRDEALRRLKWEAHIETILQRDLRLILETTLSYTTLRNLLAVLASAQGQPLELLALARKSRISVPTLRKLMAAFEGLFLIRILPTLGGEKRPTVFFEDQGEAQHLADFSNNDLGTLTNLLYMHLRVPFLTPLTRGAEHFEMFQYRTRGGSYIPFGFRHGSQSLGIIPSLEENPTPHVLGSARSFVKTFPDSKVAIIHPFEKVDLIAPNIASLPLSHVLL